MYERMLDKHHKPTWAEFISHCGDCQSLLEELDCFLSKELKSEKLLRFPYGNSYGWGLKYFIKSKHICDLFAEKSGFTVMLRLTNAQFEKQYHMFSDATKKLIDEKYPCGAGGWVHYRISAAPHMKDIKMLLALKAASK